MYQECPLNICGARQQNSVIAVSLVVIFLDNLFSFFFILLCVGQAIKSLSTMEAPVSRWCCCNTVEKNNNSAENLKQIPERK